MLGKIITELLITLIGSSLIFIMHIKYHYNQDIIMIYGFTILYIMLIIMVIKSIIDFFKLNNIEITKKSKTKSRGKKC